MRVVYGDYKKMRWESGVSTVPCEHCGSVEFILGIQEGTNKLREAICAACGGYLPLN